MVLGFFLFTAAQLPTHGVKRVPHDRLPDQYGLQLDYQTDHSLTTTGDEIKADDPFWASFGVDKEKVEQRVLPFDCPKGYYGCSEEIFDITARIIPDKQRSKGHEGSQSDIAVDINQDGAYDAAYNTKTHTWHQLVKERRGEKQDLLSDRSKISVSDIFYNY